MKNQNVSAQASTRITAIDGLRCLAICAVVTYHFFPFILPSGFLGVDLFFVISGFVITETLNRNKAMSASFLAQFIVARLNRLLPALLIIIFYSVTFGYLYFSDQTLIKFSKEIIEALFFLVNLSWIIRGVDYFSADAVSMFLLHLWSLGIEFQFYLLFPFLFFFRRNTLNLIVLGVAGSFIYFCYLISVGSENSAFFNPFARFWEFLIGSWLAFNNTRLSSYFKEMHKNLLGLVSLCALIFLFLSTKQAGFGWLAQVLCAVLLGSCLIVFSIQDRLVINRILSFWVFRSIGNFSYSWYLWHWVILVSIKILLPSIGFHERVAGIILSGLIAYLTWRIIERWFGRNRLDYRRLGIIAVTYSLCLILALLIAGGFYNGDRRANEVSEFVEQFEWKFWSDDDCVGRFNIRPCFARNDQNFRTVLIGDSHANHLVPGLLSSDNSTLHRLFNGGKCPPLFGVKIGVTLNQKHHNCAGDRSLERVVELLDGDRLGADITTIILSANWSVTAGLNDLSVAEIPVWGSVNLFRSGGGYVDKKYQFEVFRNSMLATIQMFVGKGLEVIVVGDTPQFRLHPMEHCVKRFKNEVIINCKVPRRDVQFEHSELKRWFHESVAKIPNVSVVDLDNVFCDEEECFLVKDGVLLFRDMHHLAEGGSHLVEKEISSALRSK